MKILVRCPFIRYRALRKFCGLYKVMRIPVLKHFANSDSWTLHLCDVSLQARDEHLVDAGDLIRNRNSIAVELGVNNDHGVAPAMMTIWKSSPCQAFCPGQ